MTSNARIADSIKKHPLDIRTCLATNVFFDKDRDKPKAIDIYSSEGRSLYKTDPRYDSRQHKKKKRAFASKDVILAEGTLNTAQLLKLSAHGAGDELQKFDIFVVAVHLPGVGTILRDDYKNSVVCIL